jgi:hypothetical protein
MSQECLNAKWPKIVAIVLVLIASIFKFFDSLFRYNSQVCVRVPLYQVDIETCGVYVVKIVGCWGLLSILVATFTIKHFRK